MDIQGWKQTVQAIILRGFNP